MTDVDSVWILRQDAETDSSVSSTGQRNSGSGRRTAMAEDQSRCAESALQGNALGRDPIRKDAIRFVRRASQRLALTRLKETCSQRYLHEMDAKADHVMVTVTTALLTCSLPHRHGVT